MANAARVHAVERGDDRRRAHADRLRRRGAAACRARRREARHRARDRAAECRRRLGGRLPGRARSPTSWCAAATCGSTLSMPPARHALLDEMATRGARAGRAGRARRADARAARSPSCAMSAGPRDHGRRCRARRLTADDAHGAARDLRARLCGAVRPPDPGRRDRGAELVGAGLDRGARARSAHGAGAPRRARRRRSAAARSSTAARAARIDVPVYRRERMAAGRARCRARRSSPRTRPRPSSRRASTRISTAPAVS